MAQISEKLLGLTGGGSDGWEVFGRARAMIADGIHVTELTIGEHDIRTAPQILEAMHKAAKDSHTGYASIPGTHALRDAVAERITNRTGVPTARENVLITPGGQAALFAAHTATCDTGDVAHFIDPYYATYPGTVRGVGAIASPIAALPDDGFQPNARTIEAALSERSTSLMINTPNNPTGVIYTRDTLEAIAQVCIRRDLWLISDEVYDTQVWQGEHLSPRALPGMAERTLVVGSMSKSHAMTGSRCGWVVGPKEAIAHLTNLATHTTYGVPGYIQDAALYALQQGTPLEVEIAAPFARRRAIAQRVIGAQNLLQMIPADGAMYLMLDVRGTGLTGEAFANRLLDERHIAVMPGGSFGSSAAGHVRIAMTVDDARFETALEEISAFAQDLA